MGSEELPQMFLKIQIMTALYDAKLYPKEHEILLTIVQNLGFSLIQLDELLKRWQAEFNFYQGGNNNQTSIEYVYSLAWINRSLIG